MILPWNTPRLSPSSTVLNTSRLMQAPAVWSATSVVSACWRPFSSVAPRMPATVPSPLKWTNSWLRTTAAAVVNRNSLKRACAPIAAIRLETCSEPAPSPVILMWSTWASSPTSISSAVLTW